MELIAIRKNEKFERELWEHDYVIYQYMNGSWYDGNFDSIHNTIWYKDDDLDLDILRGEALARTSNAKVSKEEVINAKSLMRERI